MSLASRCQALFLVFVRPERRETSARGQAENEKNCRCLGMPDARFLSTYPSLTPPDLEAAWDYVAGNRDEIEQAIPQNEEGDNGPTE